MLRNSIHSLPWLRWVDFAPGAELQQVDKEEEEA